MTTIRKSAIVKVMLSHNYNHFEASIALENEEGLSVQDIDDARKDCNRLCDKAIKQYKEAKIILSERAESNFKRGRLEIEVDKLRQKEGELTPHEKAKIKTLEDYNWDRQWDYDDDFDQDDYYSPEDHYMNEMKENEADIEDDLEL